MLCAETGVPTPQVLMLGAVILNGLTTQLPMRRVASDHEASFRKNLILALRERLTWKLAASFQQ